MELPSNMHRSILIASGSAGAIGFPGAFGAHADIPFVAGVWAGLVVTLAHQAGHHMEKAAAVKIVAGVMAGIGIFATGIKAANTYFTFSGVGTLPAIAANMGVNASLTYVFGRAVARTFLSRSVGDSAETIITTIVSYITGFGDADTSPNKV